MTKFFQKILIFCLFCLVFNQIQAQVTIADGLPGCLDGSIIQEGQGCGGGITFFGINGSGQFQVQNVDGINCCPSFGGDGQTYFQFGTVNISNYSNVTVSIDFSADNTAYEDDDATHGHGSPIFNCFDLNPPDNSHDQISFWYSIDGGPFIMDRYVHGLTQADFTGVWNLGPISGNTLTIKVHASNKASAEIFYFSNLKIMGTPILTAGPDKTVCVGQSVRLEGVGTGTWSGGIGVFSDITSPTSTYTPDASEVNTSITLTFTGVPSFPGCHTTSDDMTLTIGLLEDASFSLNDFCAPNSANATIFGTTGGTFVFDPPPGDGATINPVNGMISNAVGGHSYSVKYITPGDCFDERTVIVNALEGPVGTLSGSDILCPGQCTTFSFSFSSGSEPFTLELTVSPPGFSLPPIPGVVTSQVFTICYMGSGPFPTYDSGTSTITIPTIYTGSGSLFLTGISDNSGCAGMASGSFNLTLTAGPTANSAGPLTQCADLNGTAAFDLTALDFNITGGNPSYSVIWFEDAAGTIQITNPFNYISSGGIVFAQVFNGACNSSSVPITLIVETTNIPFLDMVCGFSGQDNCTVCLMGNSMELGFNFGDNNNYYVTVVDNSTLLQYNGTVSNFTALSVPVTGSTSFQLIDIQPINGCPNIAVYNDLVTINVVTSPDIDPVNILTACQSIVLPPITGTNLSGNAKYYTGQNGTGIAYDPGITITSSLTLYIYDEYGGCADEETVDIIIIPLVVFDVIPDIEGCGSVILPDITGDGVSDNAYYSTNSDGTGNTYLQGSMITTSVVLYVFDPNADPSCTGNPVSVTIVIHDAPPVPNISSIDCTGGNNTGSFQILSPVGAEYEYQIDNRPFQNTVNFSNVSNGSHTITVLNIITGCISSILINVNCDCPNPAIITIPNYNEHICLGDTFNLVGITFGGGATNVVITSDGSGSFSPQTSNTSPFNFQYIPSAADAGKTISFSIMSNDPDGSGSCLPFSAHIKLMVHNLPTGVIQGDTEVCTNGEVVLTALGGMQYAWSDSGGVAATALFSNLKESHTFYVTITDNFGCKNILSHSVTIKEFTAGRDTFAVFCNIEPAIVNLFEYISAGIDTTGIWKLGDDTIKTPKSYLMTNLPIGDTLFHYIIVNSVCGIDTANFMVTINNGNNAGNDFTGQYCQNSGTVLDLYSLLGKYDNGGKWSLRSGNLDISNPSSLDITNAPIGRYELYYITGNSNCVPDTALVTLFVISKPNAGNDINTSVCIGSQIDLFTLLSGVDKTGRFLNPNMHSGLSGSLWNTNGLDEGTYRFEYVVDGVFPCASAKANVNIELKPSLNAGPDIMETFCDTKTIRLSDYLNTADKGGTFYYLGQPVSDDIFATFDNVDTYIFTYEVGDGITCPEMTSTITLSKVNKPEISNISMNDICIGGCNEMIIELESSDVSLVKFHITELSTNWTQSGTIVPEMENVSNITWQICSGNPPFNNSNLPPNGQFVVVIDSIQVKEKSCVFNFDQPITFRTLNLPEKHIDMTLCSNETFTLEGKEFSISNPKGEVTIPSVIAGVCDTLVYVNLQFYPEQHGRYEASFCDVSKTVTIGNETFSYTNPTGVAVLIGAGSNGCDSIINVRINYDKIVIPGNYTYTTCDEGYQLSIGGQVFDKNNPVGQALIPDLAVGGCDSLVNVNLIFEAFQFDYIIENTCEAEPIILHIVTANQPGPYTLRMDGVEIISQVLLPVQLPVLSGTRAIEVISQSGCISIVQIKVDPNPASPDVQLTQVPLPNESVQITVISPQNSIYSLDWTPVGTLSCNDCFNPIATPAVTTTYYLNYQYGNGCNGIKSITVERINAEVNIPNIFSPNNDGVNDNFFVFVPDKLIATIKNMSIYDRWGNLMFQIENGQPNDPDYGWDGKFGTGIVNPGVYVYKVEIFFGAIGSSKLYSGSLTVVR